MMLEEMLTAYTESELADFKDEFKLMLFDNFLKIKNIFHF